MSTSRKLVCYNNNGVNAEFQTIEELMQEISFKNFVEKVNPGLRGSFKETKETFVMPKVSLVLCPLWNNWNSN